MKEDEDFILLPEDIWTFLHSVYGGTPIKRLPIKIEKEEGDKTEEEFVIEVFLKKVYIYILPKVRDHISLRKPSPLFISRKATV